MRKDTKIVYLYLISLGICSLLLIFYTRVYKLKNTNIVSKGEDLYLKQLKTNLEKISNISFLKNILNKKIGYNNIVLIYNDNSCLSCVDKGKTLFYQVDSNKINKFILNLTKNTDISGSSNKKEYFECSEIGKYLKKINYIETPIIIKFNSKYQILDAFFPGVQNNTDFKSFIKN